MLFRRSCGLLITLAAACTGPVDTPTSSQAQDTLARAPSVAPPEAAVEPTPGELSCKVSCSHVKLRTSVAEVSWKAAPAGGLGRALQEQALDMTVYPDGFKQGAFVRLFPLRQGQSFSLPTGQPAPFKAVPPSLALQPVEVITREQEGRIGVRLSGLEPGLRYTWRVTLPASGGNLANQTVSCMAPVCPADMQPLK